MSNIVNVPYIHIQVKESCSLCSSKMAGGSGTWNENFLTCLLSELNESQKKAVLAGLNNIHCKHNNKSPVELIWGPPGTGKTTTVSVLLFALFRMEFRTLTCAPTNVAITVVAERVLKLVKESEKTTGFCPLGDILLFGNKERLKVNSDIEELFLDYRVQMLAECFGPLGLWYSFTSMTNFLEDCVPDYHIFLENESMKERAVHKSFLEYARERFTSTAPALRSFLLILCTHIPKAYFLEHNVQEFDTLFGLLDNLETWLFLDHGVSDEEIEKLFLQLSVRSRCRSVLRTLLDSRGKLKLPRFTDKNAIRKFCFQRASLLFSTASSSYEIFKVGMKSLNVLVIDEAAQLKECESAIPLQLPGIAHSILIGDECQLPATVLSNVCKHYYLFRFVFGISQLFILTFGHFRSDFAKCIQIYPNLNTCHLKPI